MTEIVVHVTTLEQWKSVLDVWFAQRYKWNHINNKCYMEHIFNNGAQYLILDNKYIRQSLNNFCERPFIEYSEFMAQQKEDKKMETYYVTREQLDLIEELKESSFPVYKFYGSNKFQTLAVANELSSIAEKALLRYIGGDETIEFKVKEPLYRLWRIDDENDKVYMKFAFSTPDWSTAKLDAFTAPLDEIKQWKTPAWDIEKAE